MTRKSLCISFGAVLALAFVVIAPAARATDLDQATQLTFNQAVEVPGHVVLPAGTYWFVLSDDAVTTPDIVRILNVDRTQLLATTMAIPALRTKVTDHTELTFAEPSQTQPITLMSWFYPGHVTGLEFVYPSREEAKLSESEQITVLSQTARPVAAS